MQKRYYEEIQYKINRVFSKSPRSSSKLEEVQGEILRNTKKRISSSETMSLYSDIPEWEFYVGGLKGLSSREAIGLILCFPRDHWLYWEVQEEIIQQARKYKYQGDWYIVQKLIEIQYYSLQLNIILEIFNTNQIFGNFITLGSNRINRIKVQKRLNPKIKYPQRKRGYNDHGSRKDDSLWLPKDVHIGPNPERPDRTEKIKRNPLNRIQRFLWF